MVDSIGRRATSADISDHIFALIELLCALLEIDRKTEAVVKFAKTLSKVATRAPRPSTASSDAAPSAPTVASTRLPVAEVMQSLGVAGLVLRRELLFRLLRAGRVGASGAALQCIAVGERILLSDLIPFPLDYLNTASLLLSRQSDGRLTVQLAGPHATDAARNQPSAAFSATADVPSRGVNAHDFDLSPRLGGMVAMPTQLELRVVANAARELRKYGLRLAESGPVPMLRLSVHVGDRSRRSTIFIEE